jgi:UDP-N-acetylglucosamine--N-acetylmuramyl-(pentapeptide) pyrophosphoryl-undecaprenol N-acetylglucosamine transferase
MAVAQALRESDAAAAVLLVGRRGGIEETLVPAAGLDLETLDVRGIDTTRPLGMVGTMLRLPRAVARARRIIHRFAPDIVVGAAGYVCVPVVLAARSQRVPVVLMEQNALPGRAVRRLAKRSQAVAVSFAGTKQLLPGARVVHTGNPVRPEVIAALPAPRRERCGHLLIMGGSQGARRINDAVAGGIHHLLEANPELVVTHSCGTRDADWSIPVRAGLPEEMRERYTVAAWFDDIAERIRDADLVLMRAGGSSLAEVSVLGRAMILVPYPYAGAHQNANASAYVEAGAAVLVPDEELSAVRLREEVERLLHDEARWRAMSDASVRSGVPDATDRVIALLHDVLAEHRRGHGAVA